MEFIVNLKGDLGLPPRQELYSLGRSILFKVQTCSVSTSCVDIKLSHPTHLSSLHITMNAVKGLLSPLSMGTGALQDTLVRIT